MHYFNKPTKLFLISGLALITIGFICMKLETAEFGLGWLALTVAPLLILSGFTLVGGSIFGMRTGAKRTKNEHAVVLCGWGVFSVSMAVYLSTMATTASLWDCSEFIACAYKLQVPHAPGAPLFLMVGRVFSMLALDNTQQVAYWVNMVSVVSSALAAMFTFWSLVMLGKKMGQTIPLWIQIFTGSIGSFILIFSDTFWYSAVEAETYAMATLLMTVCFWSALKWNQADDVRAYRWLVFVIFILGLSVGVHPMALLVLPAVAIIVIFKNKSFSWKRLLVGAVLGAMTILFLNHIVLFGLPDALKYTDIFFVNSLGLPFYSGVFAFLLIMIVVGVFVYRWGNSNRRPIIGLVVVGLMYFLIGYSSYFMIIIRSQANTPIDEHNPENLMTLTSYLKRASYGTRPLLYGPNFDANIKAYKNAGDVYSKRVDKYEITDQRTKYEYDKTDMTILPRMYSSQSQHTKTYQDWTGLKKGQRPKFVDNLRFMFSYQFGHMYFRYLMFNFAGRESDIQHAPWMMPWDDFEAIPESISKNKARNNYWMLPFLLGMAGILLQYGQDKRGFWSVAALFLFFGLILSFYLNPTPNEPRERDYIYVGSFWAFAMWCGLGCQGLVMALSRTKPQLAKVAAGLLVLVPLLMIWEGYDDHDRSGRTLQVDHARNTLASCAPNAILFTGGDNDTFPLWYVQEVEDFRTDVRVIVLSYFNTDWYIDQMRRQVYGSAPLPFSLKQENYQQGGLNDILPFVENSSIKGAIDIKRYFDLVRNENKALQVNMSGNTIYNSVPSKTFYLEVDKESVLEQNAVPKDFQDKITTKLLIPWQGNYLEKAVLMVLDLIANNDWSRPIYFNSTSLNTIALDLKKSVLQEGQVYRLLPIQLDEPDRKDLNKMYQNLMENASYHRLEDEGVYYHHEDHQLRVLQNIKSNYIDLANGLLEKGDLEKAKEVTLFAYSRFYGHNMALGPMAVGMVELLFELDEQDEAMAMGERVFAKAEGLLSHYQDKGLIKSRDATLQLYSLKYLVSFGQRFGTQVLAGKSIKLLEKYMPTN